LYTGNEEISYMGFHVGYSVKINEEKKKLWLQEQYIHSTLKLSDTYFPNVLWVQKEGTVMYIPE